MMLKSEPDPSVIGLESSGIVFWFWISYNNEKLCLIVEISHRWISSAIVSRSHYDEVYSFHGPNRSFIKTCMWTLLHSLDVPVGLLCGLFCRFQAQTESRSEHSVLSFLCKNSETTRPCFEIQRGKCTSFRFMYVFRFLLALA